MITQTTALLVDAYRELNAKKLFWVVLALSVLVVGVFASFGLDQTGYSFLWMHWESGTFNSATFPPEVFYKNLFIQYGIGLWLSWIATILALVSTAGMFPDFVAGGSIELTLSKPIGRLRLFLTKYAFALLFVALQVAVFAGASFLLVGFRGGVWEPRIFLSIPIILAFFSFLFCVCAVLGLLTRSTLAALLLTIVFWFLLFLFNTADQVLLGIQYQQQDEAAAAAADVERLEEQIAELEAQIAEAEANGGLLLLDDGEDAPAPDDAGEDDGPRGFLGAVTGNMDRLTREPISVDDLELRLDRGRTSLESSRAEQRDRESTARLLGTWHDAIFVAKTVLPKTQETIAYLDRLIFEDEEEEQLMEFRAGAMDVDDPMMRASLEIRDRSALWILGTSFAFEFVVLGFGAWRFCRRDF